MAQIGFSLGTPMGRLTAKDMGVPDYVEALSKGIELGAKPSQLTEALLSQTLTNKLNQVKAQYAPQQAEADLQGSLAGTDMVKQNTYKQQLLNKFLPQREQAEISEIGARGDYYRRGGAGMPAGAKYQMAYMDQVANDNPNLNQQQLQEAANAYAMGKNVLSDGTPLAAQSPLTKLAFDNLVKSGSTAQGINLSNQANQADAELDVFTDLASKWAAPYGTTYFGASPEQIMDTSFRSKDPKVQKQLGELIASNALQFEIAQIRNRIAGGAPGITSTQQLMDEAQQHIQAYWPKLSGEARKVANDKLNEAIKRGLVARNKVGFGAGATYATQFDQDKANKYDTVPGKAKGEMVGMTKNGVFHLIPADKAEDAAKNWGYKYE